MQSNPLAGQDQPFVYNTDHIVPSVCEDSLAKALTQTRLSDECRVSPRLSFDLHAAKRCLFVPADMPSLQPRSYAFLQGFAKAYGMQIVEDRREASAEMDIEHRKSYTAQIAAGFIDTLKHLKLPGQQHTLSRPHRLHAGNQAVELDQLIRMAAFAAPRSKHILVNPKALTHDVLTSNQHPLNACACRLHIDKTRTTILSQFFSPDLQAVGYASGTQYVIHFIAASGTSSSPRLWTPFKTLTGIQLQFKLFTAPNPQDDIGLCYQTFYIDAESGPAEAESATALSAQRNNR